MKIKIHLSRFLLISSSKVTTQAFPVIHRFSLTVLVAFAIVQMGCRETPPVSATTEQRNSRIEATPFHGAVYRSGDESVTLTLISPNECELREGKTTFLCTYSNREEALRVLLRAAGSDQVLYFRFVDEGLKDNDEKLLLSPQYFTIHRAESKRLRHQYQDAIAECDELIKSDPRFVPAYFERASVWNEMGNFEAAIADYTAAIAVEPGFAAYCNRANTKQRIGDYDGAVADFRKLVEFDPGNPVGYTESARVNMLRSDYQGAIADFSAAPRLIFLLKP